MQPRVYSEFWLTWAWSGLPLSAVWQGRDTPVKRTAEHPAEALGMQDWLRLADATRADIVEQYSGSRPRVTKDKGANL